VDEKSHQGYRSERKNPKNTMHKVDKKKPYKAALNKKKGSKRPFLER
jgi:hypothetical protein